MTRGEPGTYFDSQCKSTGKAMADAHAISLFNHQSEVTVFNVRM